MSSMLFLRFFILLAALFISLHAPYGVACAERVPEYRTDKKNRAEPSKQQESLLDENLINIIDGYSLRQTPSQIKRTTDNNTLKHTVEYNLKKYTTNDLNLSPQYLTSKILAKTDKAMLEKMLPAEYSIFDMPKRDNSPINRLGMDSNMNNYPEYSNTVAGVTNILLDMFFGTITRNTLSLNINQFDNANSISLSVTPVKGLALKIGREDGGNQHDKSVFEVKYKYGDDSNLKLKTSESPSETKAGIEFEIKF